MSENISNAEIQQIITKRVRQDYHLKEQEMMTVTKDIILLQLRFLDLSGDSVIHDNQQLLASQIITAFHNRKIINVMVIADPQSGKTGSMCAFIKQYLEGNLIPIENIYIITGLSSIEWKRQTKKRMPASLQSRVFHRCELPNKFLD